MRPPTRIKRWLGRPSERSLDMIALIARTLSNGSAKLGTQSTEPSRKIDSAGPNGGRVRFHSLAFHFLGVIEAAYEPVRRQRLIPLSDGDGS